jgi:hypothetical protein
MNVILEGGRFNKELVGTIVEVICHKGGRVDREYIGFVSAVYADEIRVMAKSLDYDNLIFLSITNGMINGYLGTYTEVNVICSGIRRYLNGDLDKP